jgi:hypothetical protein
LQLTLLPKVKDAHVDVMLGVPCDDPDAGMPWNWITVQTAFEFDDIADAWILISRSDFKNYDNEVDLFFDWLLPYIDAEDVDINELTPNERQQAYEKLSAMGVQQVTDETMTEAYLQILEARGLKVNR